MMLLFCMFLPAVSRLLLPVLLPGIVHGFLLVREGSVGSAHATRTILLLHSTVTPTTASTTTASHAQPLAIHGDWQAFFDEDRYCLMYYFNTKTGESQWEPPPDFPIPKLDSHASSPLTAPVAATTHQSSSYLFFATADDDEKPQHHQQHSHHSYYYDAASAAASSTATDVTTTPHTAATTQQQQQQQSDVAAVVFKAALGFAATLAGKAVEAVTDHVKKQQQIQQQQRQQQIVQENNKNTKVQTKKEEDKPWWLSFFYQEKQNRHQEPEEPIPIRSRSEHVMDLLSEIDNKLNSSPRKRTPSSSSSSSSSGMHHVHKQQQQQQHHHHTTAKKQQQQQNQMTFWPSWNTVNNNNNIINNKSNTNTAVDEPTKPLVPPRRREQWLQEKLYADSLKRQENLRKSYRRVIENRSPTISLSALKRDHKKDWHQYLNDDV